MCRDPSRCVALVLVALAAAGCAAPPQPTATAEPLAAGHHSPDLRQLMRRMQNLLYDRNQTELELDKQRLARARDLAATAGELAAGAERLAPPAATSSDAGAAFAAYATALATEATRLGQLAEERRYDEIEPQIERVYHRCAACHQRFRPR